MFGNIRKKLNSVIQDGLNLSENISTNIKNSTSPIFTLPGGIASGSQNTSPHHIVVPKTVNIYAGCELLEKYENDWSEIHLLNEQNVDRALKIDKTISTLNVRAEKFATDISDLNISLVSLPTVINTLNNCLETIADIESKCQNMEVKLIDLEDLFEVLELQEKQLDHRFEMAMYKEKKLAELERVRQELAAQHAANVKEYELSLRKMQQERQMAFQEAFQDDLKTFKEKGSIPSRFFLLEYFIRYLNIEELSFFFLVKYF